MQRKISDVVQDMCICILHVILNTEWGITLKQRCIEGVLKVCGRAAVVRTILEDFDPMLLVVEPTSGEISSPSSSLAEVTSFIPVLKSNRPVFRETINLTATFSSGVVGFALFEATAEKVASALLKKKNIK